MTIRSGLLVGLRVVAAVAVIVFAVLAYNRSTAEVTFTFPASETTGLSEDVVYRCGNAPTGLEDPPGVVGIEGSTAYNDWALARAKETGVPPETTEAKVAACEASRDSRLIALIWFIAGALTAGLILVGSAIIPARRH